MIGANCRLTRKLAVGIAIFGGGLMACASSTQDAEPLTIDEKIGQLVVVAAQGSFMNESSSAYQRLLRLVRDEHVGGIIWYGADVYETAWVNDRLQAAASIPLLISADLESGLGMRFDHTTFWPWAMAMAATGDPALVEMQGRIVAREAKLLGINHILAPVADVNGNPDNPVINVRSYGEDPVEVGELVSAFIRGVQSEGVLATVKHFPGHGDTRTDSHRSLPTFDVDRDRLDRVELLPFRAAIRSGVGSVMLAHLSIPEVEPEKLPRGRRADPNPYADDETEVNPNATLPVSLSPVVVDGLLRRSLGFDGLVITDALDMGGISDYFNAGEAAVRAIEAGADQVLKTADTDRSLRALKEAVATGRISMERLDRSVDRILAAKRRVEIHEFTPAEIFREVDRPENRKFAQEAAEKAITLVRMSEAHLPLRPELRIVQVTVGDFRDEPGVLSTFSRALDERVSSPVRRFRLDRTSSTADTDEVIAAAAVADLVLFTFTVRTRSGQGSVAVPAPARKLIATLAGRDVPMIGISFGNPYLLREIPELGTYVAAYGVQPVMQLAAARAIFGERRIGGRLPVTIPGIAPRGTGLTLEKP